MKIALAPTDGGMIATDALDGNDRQDRCSPLATTSSKVATEDLMTNLNRRNLLKGTALVLIGDKVAHAGIVTGHLPWEPNAGSPPQAAREGPWMFFTAQEA